MAFFLAGVGWVDERNNTNGIPYGPYLSVTSVDADTVSCVDGFDPLTVNNGFRLDQCSEFPYFPDSSIVFSMRPIETSSLFDIAPETRTETEVIVVADHYQIDSRQFLNYTLYSFNGSLINSGSYPTVVFSDLSKGFYTLRVLTSEGYYFTRCLKP